MNSLQLVNKIKTKADDLGNNIQQILSMGTAFSSLEKDLLKKQCTDLYELILKLKTEQDTVMAEPTAPKTEPITQKHEPVSTYTPEPILQESGKPLVSNEVKNWVNPENEELTLDEIETQMQVVSLPEDDPDLPPMPPRFEEIINEAAPAPKPIIEFPPFEINVEKAVENKRILKTVMPAIEEPKTVTLNQSFENRPNSFNDKNSIEQFNPIVEKTVEAPLDNIKAAINLNKKIAFVNELFNENVVDYAKSIERLNQASDLNEGMQIFEELKGQFQWNSQNDLVNEMEKLVRRRYS